MNKKTWIFFSIVSVFVNVLLVYLLNYNLNLRRKIILRDNYKHEIKINSVKSKFNVIVLLTNKKQCYVGISSSFIKSLLKKKKNHSSVYFVVEKKEKNEIDKIREKFKVRNLYYDLNNSICLRLGGVFPSIVIVDNKSNIIFYSPIFSNEKMNKLLLNRINQIVNLPI